ncbi:hypothetical protein ACFVYG_22365 [Streptomyces sp. NPDC058256]|uniref:hypothetical protein n=1 Tax=Streptomyces sp. NPDC058256 TaxID=3346408 RepID=UPI0036E5CCA1
MASTAPDPESGPTDRCFTRREPGGFAEINGPGGLTGRYTQDLTTIMAGHRIGLYDAHLGRAVIGTVSETQHDTNTAVFAFEEHGFRVVHGTEPVMADWRTYRWHSPATAPHLHAVAPATDCASAPYTHRYAPRPGRSLAFVDLTGHGGPGDEWLYGAPYRSSRGQLAPWCQHCGLPMTAPTSQGETTPYIDVADGEPLPACRDARAHHPIYIWTPHDHACATPPQNLPLTNDNRDRDGKPPLDPFDVQHIDEAETYPVSQAVEWLDAAVYGHEFVEQMMKAPGVERPCVTRTTDQRIERARLGELSERPVTAEIRLGYPLAGGGAMLRLTGKDGHATERHTIQLTDRGRTEAETDPLSFYPGEITDGAMTEGLLIAAGWHLARLGFNYARGMQWAPHTGSERAEAQRAQWSPKLPEGARKQHTARVAIVPTAAYLAYQERRFGPVPDLGDLPPGIYAEPTQRGRWRVSKFNRLFWQLTWTPALDGDRWRVWTGPNATQILITADSAGAALAQLAEHAREK